MTRGRVELRTRAAATLLMGEHGLGTRLHFVDAQTGEATLAPLGIVAHRCDSCDAVLIEGEGLEDALDCFECGTRIPPNVEACPACGWTW